MVSFNFKSVSLIVLLSLGLFAYFSRPPVLVYPKVNDAVGGQLSDLSGKTFSFTESKGHWVLVSYWASWCNTCMDEIPALNEFYRKHNSGSQAVKLLGVNLDALPASKLKLLTEKLQIVFPNTTTDPRQKLGINQVRAVPFLVLISPKGEICHQWAGKIPFENLEKAIQKETC